MENINVFISYAHRDEKYKDELKIYLAPLRRVGMINIWNDAYIEAGRYWDKQIKSAMNEADLILLLISADFLASEYLYSVELQEAIRKSQQGSVRILPIILRACDWTHSPLSSFKAVPRNAKPISSWASSDDAYLDVIRAIRINIQELAGEKKVKETTSHTTTTTLKKYLLTEVFVSSGPPTVTFVEPKDFMYIKLALLQPGRGIVIEGPSGIGKTTVALKVLEQTNNDYHLLSARLDDHVDKIKTLKDWHNGTLVIDDFHRLSRDLQEKIANYLKYLADYGIKEKKLVIIGILNTGDTLIRISFDLANRITIFKLGSVDDETLSSLISKGEKALNIEFKRKNGIVREAFGSLYIAQLLCAYIALHNQVLETQKIKTNIDTGILDVIDRVIKDLSPKYDDTVRPFASIGGRKSKTCIQLLSELALTEDGVLNLNYLEAKKPELRDEIEKFLRDNLFKQFYSDNPQGARHLLFDKNIPALIIDDPQFKFFLNNVSIEKLAVVTGKLSTSTRNKVFISYSRNDEEWLKKLLVHLKHLEKKGIIDLWVDTRIDAGQNWREEIQQALNQTKIAVLLLTPDFLASDFIVDNEMPPLLKAVEQDSVRILQLFVRPCSIKGFEDLSQFQMVNNPKTPLAALSQVKQDEVLVKLAEFIEQEITEE